MSNKDIEIEIKLPLKNGDDVKKFLNKKARLISKDVLQRDTYYVPAHRDFFQVKYPYEWLRLRESGKGASINYKHFHPENVRATEYCDEYESNIDNVGALKKIFKSIECKEAVVVEKVRTTWMYDDVEIVVDDVRGLGSFIELKATTYFDSPKEGKEFLFSKLEELNAIVGEEDLRGYPFRLLEKQGYVFS